MRGNRRSTAPGRRGAGGIRNVSRNITTRERSMAHCILLNADYSFLNLVSWRRAMCLMAKNKVEILKYSDQRVGLAEGEGLLVPAVMRLIKLIRTIYRSRVPFSKRNVLVRDRFACVYCGQAGGHLTIDHIIPRSRGGATDFDNCVACCRPCNAVKGNRTPREARMTMHRRPFQPTIAEFIRLKFQAQRLDTLLEGILW